MRHSRHGSILDLAPASWSRRSQEDKILGTVQSGLAAEDRRPAFERRTLSPGFTRTELSVLIAMIILLATILFVWLGGAKRDVQGAVCRQNLHELGLALHGYVTDNHAYPLFVDSRYMSRASPGNLMSWIPALAKRVAEEKPAHTKSQYWEKLVWECPAGGRPSGFPASWGYMDYGYNANGLFRGETDPDWLGLGGHLSATPQGYVYTSPVKDWEVVNPAKMMALADAIAGAGTILQDGGIFRRTSTPPSSWIFWPNCQAAEKRVMARHHGNANVGFCDGHVESLSLRSLFGDKSDAALSRWNRDNQPHHERLAQ